MEDHFLGIVTGNLSKCIRRRIFDRKTEAKMGRGLKTKVKNLGFIY